jgi:hypothetical protein
MFWLFVVALWTAMLLSPIVLLYIFLPTGRGCPRCNQETLPLQSRMLKPLRRLMTLRWCIECGWQGIARNGTTPEPVVGHDAAPEVSHEPDSEAPWRNNSAN